MFCAQTNRIYYIGQKIKDRNTQKIGFIYQIKVLGSTSIKVRFLDNTKKAYFCNQLNEVDFIDT